MISIVLYSIDCPKCRVLKRKLDEKHIPYSVVSDLEVMEILGIQQVPVLSVNGELFDFSKAIEWVNNW